MVALVHAALTDKDRADIKETVRLEADYIAFPLAMPMI